VSHFGELWAFALLIAIGQFSPGPDMLLLTRTALAEGLKAGWLMVFGIVTGLAFHATLAIGGMAALLARGGTITFIVKIIAAAYLCWLAWGLFKKTSAMVVVGAIPKRGPYLRGLFCNLLNPKVLIFFAGVMAPFLTPGHPEWWPLALWAMIIFEGLALWCVWVWLLQIPKVRAAYQRAGRFIDLAFGVGLIVLAINLLAGTL
jgi:threonine efflux protein|tara:strand:- start:896 stop:1504 length:609 start_codon:yes stop_codon:yes gene_type:complete